MACGNTMVLGSSLNNGMKTAMCNSSVSATNYCGGKSGLGPVDPTYKDKLGPRPNREIVRQQIRDYILLMLGAPVVKIELDEQQIDFAIDQALKIFEDYAPREYFSYYTFTTSPGKSVYEMPPDVGMIRQVYYKEMGNFAFQSSDLGGALPIEYFYPGGAYASIQGGMIDPTQPIWGRMGEWTLYKQYESQYSKSASNLGGWEWVGGYRHVKLYPIPYRANHVIVHYIQKNKDFMEVTQAMQEGALTYAKEMIGRIRSKYGNPPGPGGGIQLDGMTLIQEAIQERKDWKEDLIHRFGDILPITMG